MGRRIENAECCCGDQSSSSSNSSSQSQSQSQSQSASSDQSSQSVQESESSSGLTITSPCCGHVTLPQTLYLTITPSAGIDCGTGVVELTYDANAQIPQFGGYSWANPAWVSGIFYCDWDGQTHFCQIWLDCHNADDGWFLTLMIDGDTYYTQEYPMDHVVCSPVSMDTTWGSYIYGFPGSGAFEITE